jgi:membrane protein DedA with SNARE-associated domain
VLESLFLYVIELLRPLGYWGIALGMAIESACIPLPSEIVLPFGGYLAATGRITLFQAIAAGQLGGMAGSILCYWLGRSLGREGLLRWGRYILISERELDKADAWFARRGEWTVFLGRLLPGIRTFISLPAGISRMDFGRFLLYSFIGMLPWSIVFTQVGYKLGQNWLAVRHLLHRFDLVIIVLLVAAVVWFIWHRLRERRTFG